MSKNTQAAIQALQDLLGERLSTSRGVREHHGKDESFHSAHLPDAVVFPHSTEEVAEIVKICAAHKVPIMPYGTGTALEGGVAALRGGISIDMQEMNTILRVSQEDMDCTVQAGVTRTMLNEHLRDQGLFFPIDPGADASLGGMAATRASGTNAVRYGTMKDAVLALRVVTPDGEIVETAKRARKSAAGYDLTRLFVGSEGTLGVICEVTLRLHGIPEAISAAVCAFETLEGCVNTVMLTIQMGIPIARIELLDELSIRAVNSYSKTDYPEKPHLFMEFHGTEAGVKEQAEMVHGLAVEFGGSDFQWATKTEERTALWAARHEAAYAAKSLRPGAELMSTDVCVPISRLAEAIMETKEDMLQMGHMMPILGHVGDGNFHVVPAVYPDDKDEMAQIEAFHTRLVRRALRLGGTCTGEHGIGYGKMIFLEEELPAASKVMAKIKAALDPDDIMNPGKVVKRLDLGS